MLNNDQEKEIFKLICESNNKDYTEFNTDDFTLTNSVNVFPRWKITLKSDNDQLYSGEVTFNYAKLNLIDFNIEYLNDPDNLDDNGEVKMVDIVIPEEYDNDADRLYYIKNHLLSIINNYQGIVIPISPDDVTIYFLSEDLYGNGTRVNILSVDIIDSLIYENDFWFPTTMVI